jgi:predicted transposase YbfD/YdcC
MPHYSSAGESDESSEAVWFSVDSLVAYFSQLTDHRDPRGVRYPLATVLVMVMLAKLAGQDTLRGMAQWLAHRRESVCRWLGLRASRVPHQTTLSRIMSQAVGVEEMEALAAQFLAGRAKGNGQVIALDGKSLRGHGRMSQGEGRHLMAAYLPGQGVVLMQMAVEGHENEILVAPRVVEMIDLEGRVVTGDAMQAQVALSQDILLAGGDYLWIVKDNQPRLRQAIERLFTAPTMRPGFSAVAVDFRRAKQVNKGHGRIEVRQLTASAMLNDHLPWPGLAQVFQIERQRVQVRTGEITRERAYGITSLSAARAGPAELLRISRCHWEIENGLHYRRDVTFGEDACRLHRGQAAQVMAVFNNLALALIKRAGFRYAPDARRYLAAQPEAALALLTGT